MAHLYSQFLSNSALHDRRMFFSDWLLETNRGLLVEGLWFYRSAEGLSVPEDPEVVGDPEGAELQNERLEGGVGLVAERARRRELGWRGVVAAEEGHVLGFESLFSDRCPVVQERRHVGIGAVVHQRDGGVVGKELEIK